MASRRSKIGDTPEPGSIIEEKVKRDDVFYAIIYPMYVFYDDLSSSSLEGHLAPRSLEEAQKLARSLMKVQPGQKNVRRVHIYESRCIYRLFRGR